MGEADLRGANMRGVNVSRAQLYEANFGGADMRGRAAYLANFTGAEMERVNLSARRPGRSDMTKAHMRGSRWPARS